MAWEVYVLEDVSQWLLELDGKAFDRIQDAIDQLEDVGPGLGRPMVDTIQGSRHPNMKELRAGSVRILFVFDPDRRAVLLVAGDKAGLWSQWYRRAIPVADRRYDAWLAELAAKEDDDGR
ncbi:type II toxin-antitoxin system RelE/ParE family toxin [Jiangella mangrovi]|uniref:DNA-binding protein n=1 Tax=Jiangella mangrovi TaxID=1524084 RepID=A0A7W9LJ10_9ACTN|nr:hypothetical protein [Jiangella mangrovi]